MLYLIATPIGNLSDITFRAVDTLKHVDYILCEDTRHSKILLQHYSIDKHLKSFHKFSESQKQDEILEDLKNGRDIALISDAGTPGISDPGTMLVQACAQNNIQVISIPGPCAAITALSCSGLDTDRFQFLGFLPKKTLELKKVLKEILTYPGTTICYESPHRLVDVLEVLNELSEERNIAVGRELTKKFEEIVRGKPSDLIAKWKGMQIKGEIVLMISGNTNQLQNTDWETMSPQEHVEYMQDTFGISRQEAIPAVAKVRGVSKSQVYNAVHQNKSD